MLYSQICSEILHIMPTSGVGNIFHIEQTDITDIALRGRE
jgi:hypothetical protein